jgi:hypothetical protein
VCSHHTNWVTRLPGIANGKCDNGTRVAGEVVLAAGMKSRVPWVALLYNRISIARVAGRSEVACLDLLETGFLQPFYGTVYSMVGYKQVSTIQTAFICARSIRVGDAFRNWTKSSARCSDALPDILNVVEHDMVRIGLLAIREETVVDRGGKALSIPTRNEATFMKTAEEGRSRCCVSMLFAGTCAACAAIHTPEGSSSMLWGGVEVPAHIPMRNIRQTPSIVLTTRVPYSFWSLVIKAYRCWDTRLVVISSRLRSTDATVATHQRCKCRQQLRVALEGLPSTRASELGFIVLRHTSFAVPQHSTGLKSVSVVDTPV